eukprot:8016033-Pyramimonas_sp.AAC.1
MCIRDRTPRPPRGPSPHGFGGPELEPAPLSRRGGLRRRRRCRVGHSGRLRRLASLRTGAA